jgi:hypothetical protein
MGTVTEQDGKPQGVLLSSTLLYLEVGRALMQGHPEDDQAWHRYDEIALKIIEMHTNEQFDENHRIFFQRGGGILLMTIWQPIRVYTSPDPTNLVEQQLAYKLHNHQIDLNDQRTPAERTQVLIDAGLIPHPVL